MRLKHEPRASTMVLALVALGGCHSLFPFASPKTDQTVSDRAVAADRVALAESHAKEGGSARDGRAPPDKPRDKLSASADRLPDKPWLTPEGGASPCSSWDCTPLAPYGCLAICKNGKTLFKCTNGSCGCASCLPSCSSSQCAVAIGGAYLCEQCYTAFDKIAPCCAN